MVMAARLSHTMKLLSATDVDLIHDLVAEAGLPSAMELDPLVIFQNIRKDKKKRGDNIHFVLLEGLGKAVVKTIQLKDLKRIIYDLC